MIEQLSFSSTQAASERLDRVITPACPRCAVPLEAASGDRLRCAFCDTAYPFRDGLWRFLLPERHEALRGFMLAYERMRRAEHRGSSDPAYYRALPYDDLTGRHLAHWQRRARSFRTFVEWVLYPLESHLERPLRVADLGAGNGWTAYRLARRGNHVVAVDLQTDERDGLGALIHYPADVLGVQADFDQLPFPAGTFDLVVFNAALHYSPDALSTLREALRVLQPEGRLAVMDTPLFADAAQGARYVEALQATREARHGLHLGDHPMQHFLTYDELARLAAELNLRWDVHHPAAGWKRLLRPWQRLLRRDPYASCHVLSARRAG